MARTSITIVLELDETVDSPVGRACRADGTCRTFQGWLGLAEAVDSLAATPAPPGDQTPRSAAGSPGPDQAPGNQP